MPTLSRWASQRTPALPHVEPQTPTPVETEPAPEKKTSAKKTAPPPLEPAAQNDEPPAPLPRVVGAGRRRKRKPKAVRPGAKIVRTFAIPPDLDARLFRLAVGHAERTGHTFNYSAYVSAILDADLRKRGF